MRVLDTQVIVMQVIEASERIRWQDLHFLRNGRKAIVAKGTVLTIGGCA
jgi:hypothetical protein